MAQYLLKNEENEENDENENIVLYSRIVNDLYILRQERIFIIDRLSDLSKEVLELHKELRRIQAQIFRNRFTIVSK
jgi:hypothetical protein